MLQRGAIAARRVVAGGGAAVTCVAIANYIGEVRFRDDPESLKEAARILRISSLPPRHLTAKQQKTLAADGYLVVPNWLGSAHLKAARAECVAMHTSGEFSAPMGGDSVRTDMVHWLGSRSEQPALVAALAEMRALPASMRSFTGFEAARSDGGAMPTTRPPLGVPRTAQLAVYNAAETGGGGGKYRPHRDAPPHPRALLLPGIYMREVTAVLYLSPNEDEWTESGGAGGGSSGSGPMAAAGGGDAPRNAAAAAPRGNNPHGGRPGSLMLYTDAAPTDTTGASARRVVEVRPNAGTLVLFDARRMLHEVLPHGACSAERIAITVWMGGAHRGSSVREVASSCASTLVGGVYEWARTRAL